MFVSPPLQVSFWSPLPGPPARMTGMRRRGPHPEITVHFKAWINTELLKSNVECAGVISFTLL